MAITYFEKERIFKLDTPASSYVIGIVDKENFVGHVYYGKKLRDANIAYLLRTGEGPFVPSEITGSVFLLRYISDGICRKRTRRLQKKQYLGKNGRRTHRSVTVLCFT